MMHVAHVGGFADPQRRAPAALLDAWPALSGLALAVRDAGVRVTVVQAAAEDRRVQRDGVDFHFIAVPGTRRGAARIARAVRDVRPDAVHFRGLRFPLHVHALRRALPDTPILVQDHADAPPRAARVPIERILMRGTDAVAFTAAAQAGPFLDCGVLPRDVMVVEAPAASSSFSPGDREAARRALGVHGSPCIAWVGRLAAVKDPVTALDALRLALRDLPDARLWCAFTDAPAQPAVHACIAAHPELRDRVMLLGALDRARVELLLRAADVFLATSLRESTGFALLEALACGAAPVVTDIPAFRAITGNGRVGALFPARDAEAGAAALVAVTRALPSRAIIRCHFDRHLAPPALGATLRTAYDRMIERRSVALHHTVTPTRQRTRRPRVCLLVPGGVDRSETHRVIPCVLSLIERLARDVELHVLALRQDLRATQYPLHGATVHCTPRGSRTGGLRWLIRQHRTAPFDVLHALWMHPQGTTAALAGTLLRTPVLLHINGGDLADLRDIRFGGRSTMTGRIRLRAAVAGAARITVPSDAMLRHAQALGIDAERLTLGVATDRWPARAPRPRAAGEPFRLLSVGSLNRVKDHDTLLRALALLRAGGTDARLDIAGEDVSDGAAVRCAEALGVADACTFHGFVPYHELRAHYDRAHVLVVASRHEADPIAALEAALAGVAVAGSDVGHVHDWSPTAALACPPADPPALAASLRRLADDDALRLRTAAAARTLALAHDADHAAGRVLALYDELRRDHARR